MARPTAAAPTPIVAPLELLGEGGFATVYTAMLDGGEVVVKVPKAGVCSIRALEEEIRAYKQAGEHPNLLKFFGRVKVQLPERRLPSHGFAMELAAGGSLADASSLDVSVPRAATDLRSALQHLHLQDLVHRDLSCGNVLTRANGEHVLMDLSFLATAGTHTEKVGTQLYWGKGPHEGSPFLPADDVEAAVYVLLDVATMKCGHWRRLGEEDLMAAKRGLTGDPSVPVFAEALHQLTLRERSAATCADVLEVLCGYDGETNESLGDGYNSGGSDAIYSETSDSEVNDSEANDNEPSVHETFANWAAVAAKNVGLQDWIFEAPIPDILLVAGLAAAGWQLAPFVAAHSLVAPTAALAAAAKVHGAGALWATGFFL